MKHRIQHIILSVVTLSLILTGLVSCGRHRTEALLLNRRWSVYDVTPPPGPFNVEESNRAQELKDGFYQGAWFEFLQQGVFIASFGGKPDTGRYRISGNGIDISLYPKRGDKVYEQIEIRHLDTGKLSFNTSVADFHLVLHLKSAGGR